MTEPLLHRVKAAPHSEGPVWMLSLADLLSLILTFFILLYSMQDIAQTPEFREMRHSLTDRLSTSIAPADIPVQESLGIDVTERADAVQMDYLDLVLQRKFAAFLDDGTLYMHKHDDRLILTLSQDALFQDGSTTLRRDSELLRTIGESLSTIGNQVEILGHADEQAAAGSNWDLSIRRAAAVAGQLLQAGYTEPVTILGAGTLRYQRMAGALPEGTDKKLSRRVDLVIRRFD